MKHYYILCLFFFISTYYINIYAQDATIKGKIRDIKTKETLVGVNISLSNKTGTSSDINGDYKLTVKPGRNQITYNFIGYKTVKRTIEIGAVETLIIDIFLEEEVSVIDEVVISAGKFEQKLSDVTVSMAVLKPVMLENNNTTTMETALNQIPGVDVMAGQISIRGGSGYSYGTGSRVLLLVDDLPILSADASDAKWNFIPIENISQVEVIKGAASSLFGSSALNGVVNIRTAFPKNVPETKYEMFSGIYMNPNRKEMIWWGNHNPIFSGASLSHSRKIGNLDIVAACNFFSDQGYRENENEQRARINTNLRYRFKKIDGLAVGLNANYMYCDKIDFFLWQNADSGAWKQNAAAITRNKGIRLNVDPYITYISNNGIKHSLRTRYFKVTNVFDKEQKDKNSMSDLFYAEYQFQKKFKNNLNWTSGIIGTYGEVVAKLFGTHNSTNSSLYTQLDKKFGRLSASVGFRAEYFRIDSEENVSVVNGDSIKELPIEPVFRSGLNYQLAEYTFLRASFGQGYRFPSIAEKYISTNLGPLTIFPNFELKPEKGWSAELGIKQGVKLSSWKGYIDIAGFFTEYHNMMEFTFGLYDPTNNYRMLDQKNPRDSLIIDSLGFVKCGGFKSINVGNARISGIDITFTGAGTLFGIPTTLLAGYTYTYPIDLNVKSNDSIKSNNANILKYRFYHSFKADVEFNYKKFSMGMSLIYNSFMINVDKIFIDTVSAVGRSILPGYAKYREDHNTGYFVFDHRISYQINETSKFAIITKNLFNKEYMVRPGDIRPPRTITIQYTFKF